jgi:hypothetical protein
LFTPRTKRRYCRTGTMQHSRTEHSVNRTKEAASPHASRGLRRLCALCTMYVHPCRRGPGDARHEPGHVPEHKNLFFVYQLDTRRNGTAVQVARALLTWAGRLPRDHTCSSFTPSGLPNAWIVVASAITPVTCFRAQEPWPGCSRHPLGVAPVCRAVLTIDNGAHPGRDRHA